MEKVRQASSKDSMPSSPRLPDFSPFPASAINLGCVLGRTVAVAGSGRRFRSPWLVPIAVVGSG
jgi:hypothetical protein